MPYINIKTNVKVSKEMCDEIKSYIGENIGLISGKTEARLMICIEGENTMYFAGDDNVNIAFTNVVLYKTASLEDKSKLTDFLFNLLKNKLNVENSNAFIAFDEYDIFGSNGHLR